MEAAIMSLGAAGGAVDGVGTTGFGNWAFIFFLIFILLIFGVGFFSGCI
jgi:hypothetical protein